MAIQHTCNGCGKVTPRNKIKVVRVIEATLPGPGVELGLRSDRITEGELCGECCEGVHDLVGELSPDVSPEPVTA